MALGGSPAILRLTLPWPRRGEAQARTMAAAGCAARFRVGESGSMTNLWTRREWLSAAAVAKSKKRIRPNVLLIITDQHYIRAMGAAGNPYVRTPHIDSLARRGTRFANSWCTSPVCSP